MRILGVIDLRDGRAVHARGGVRARYAEVREAGHRQITGDPLALARYYKDEYGLSELYVADLDAIARGAPQNTVARAVVTVGLDVWLDTGATTAADVDEAANVGASTAVIGLETLPGYDALERLCDEPARVPLVLSLDVRDGRPVCRAACDIDGDPAEAVARRAWDAGIGTIIVLDLAHVGSDAGPPFNLIARVQAAVPEASVFVGGGIRSAPDLGELRAMGVSGVLMATALQRQAVTREALHSILAR